MKTNKFFLLFLVLTLALFTTVTAQKNKKEYYRIGVVIPHLPGKEVYLGYHFANKNYVQDTLLLDSKGRGAFSGTDTLPGGVYLLVLPNMRYVEFLVDEQNRFFTIETDTSDFFNTLHFKGSKENSDFFNYQKRLSALNKELASLHKRLRDNRGNVDSTDIIQEQIDAINRQTSELNREIIDKHPGTFLAHLVAAMTPPDVPDLQVADDVPNRDSLLWVMRYGYLRDHYFDGVDFSDERLLRSPVLYNRLNQYFNRILIQVPDSLIPQVDRIIARTAGNDKVYQYVVIFLLNNYQQANIMGLDEVYVHLAEKYYLAGKTPWADSTLLGKLQERVDHLKPNLIGHKAHDLKMETLDGQWVDLYEIDKPWVILVFWDPGCGHCKKAIPKLHDLYEQYRDKGLEVMTIYIYDNKEAWKKYLEENDYLDWINAWDPYQITRFRFYYDVYSTPVIYVLDKDKKIIAKRIDIDVLKKFLKNRIAE
jgi:thiol-disulfide isomerase/thioredoxin